MQGLLCKGGSSGELTWPQGSEKRFGLQRAPLGGIPSRLFRWRERLYGKRFCM